jgi:hypothetical protein
MENEELLSGDQTSQEQSRLNQEISREEGQGSWDSIENEPEENVEGELESGQEGPEETLEGPVGISGHLDPVGEPGEDGQEEEEEEEQKNTLRDESPRVLSFKDFFSKN